LREYDSAGNMRLGYERQLDEYRDEVYGTGHRSLYGRDEKLRFYHQYGRQVPDVGEPDGADDLKQEFRYDALGRRVLVRNLHRPFCDPQERDCTHAIERYIWDGDQLLWELRAPGDTSDNLEVQYTSGREYGRVAYVHGRGIDVPLGIARWNYVAGASFLLVPHLDWRGQWELGTDEDGERYPECGADPNCVRIGWPSTAVRSYLEKLGAEGEGDWVGSLLRDQRDPSGFLYRRNRYYDPMAGRFTQPDPIGLAGGINLYGFSGADPANFADPFGLCPPLYLCRLLTATVRVQTRYAHLQSSSVSAGATIASGGQVGLVGTTGGSTGPHLHFETRVIEPGAGVALANVNSTPVDPQLVSGFEDPLPGASVSDGFGPRIDPFTGQEEMHYGVDRPAPAGTSVGAAAPGAVVFSGNLSSYGNVVYINHTVPLVFVLPAMSNDEEDEE